MQPSIVSTLLAGILATSPILAAPPGQLPPATGPVFADSGIPRILPQVSFANSARVHDLIRAGNMYLTLSDALALAIENNLDIELERFASPAARADLLRTRGGGLPRGLLFTISEAPAGVGGPLSPVVTSAATLGRAAGTTVATNALELGALSEPQTNLSLQGSLPQSNGTPVPVFDPSVVGLLNWAHQTTPQTNSVVTGTSTLISNISTANVGVQQGFSTGTQVGLSFNNNHQALNSLRSAYNPYTGSSLGLTVTQPLLRGFGPSLNRRFIRVAGNNQRIAGLLFEQQLIATVYGVIRLYTDFVALYEDAKVKQETLNSAEKLLSDTREQVNEGTLAPVEMTRANAQVFSSRQDLINARGLLEEQEAILKNVITRRGNEDPEVQAARLIPTDTLEIPEKDEIRPIQDLIADAMAHRPDLGQGRLQLENSRIQLQGSKNATLPEVDLVGVMQNNGLSGALNPFAANPDPTFVGGYGGVLSQVFSRNYPTYGVGVQVTLPIHNRIAEADLARDELNLRQSRIRLRQLENQARLEIEDALIAMRRSRASYEAAVQARILQQESLEAEQAKFEVGASTSYFVIQYESLLAQAKSTEVAAKSAYVKARAALERATGSILGANNISVDSAYKGHL